MGSVDVLPSGEWDPVDSMFPTFSDYYILLFLLWTYFHANADYFCVYFLLFCPWVKAILKHEQYLTFLLLSYLWLRMRHGAEEVLIAYLQTPFFWRGFFFFNYFLFINFFLLYFTLQYCIGLKLTSLLGAQIILIYSSVILHSSKMLFYKLFENKNHSGPCLV